ncbi:hypothetical protein PRIPAC_84269 [Pristionchus pacificus]|nr:hypothetical protein PRIPAC_84269 [Pristionchus pacificus]
MSVINRVRTEAKSWQGRHAPSTYEDLVSMAFNDVTNTINHAKHCSYQEMYHPNLGEFRERKMYSSLAPSLCINSPNRLARTDALDLRPHRSYKPKQGEWLVERSKHGHVSPPKANYQLNRSASMDRLEPTGPSRYYNIPVSNTRFDNHFLYWKGRAHGSQLAGPFLEYEDIRPMQDRRYHRIFWSPDFINITPSCRHSTHLMLSAY